MTSPTFGIIFNPQDTDPRPSLPSDLSIIGLVLPSDDANAATFPLNEPVDFDSSDAAFLAKIGTGELAKAINAIDDQLADFQTSARIVAVRVAKGASDAETITNIIGSREGVTGAGNVGTGIYALLRAGVQLGVIPRLLGFPGYTWQTTAGDVQVANPVAAPTNVGNGALTLANPAYADGVVAGSYTVRITGAAANGGAFDVFDPTGEKIGSGVVGTAFTTQINFTLADGTTDFLVDDEWTIAVSGVTQANPLCAALPAVCSALLAHAVVGGPPAKRDVINWRETLGSERLIPVDAWRKVDNGNGGAREDDGVAAILGAQARVDFKRGGYPFHVAAGQQIYGTIGLKNYFPFSLTDGATTGQDLLASHIGVIERGELGVETAVAASGFVFVGAFNAGSDPSYWFYNKSRGRDWLHLALLKSIRLRLGVENVEPHQVQAVLNDMAVVCADMLRNGGSVGYRVGFEAAANDPTNLRQGKFRVFVANEGPAPIMQVTIDSRPNYTALEAELATLVAQAAQLPQVTV